MVFNDCLQFSSRLSTGFHRFSGAVLAYTISHVCPAQRVRTPAQMSFALLKSSERARVRARVRACVRARFMPAFIMPDISPRANVSIRAKDMAETNGLATSCAAGGDWPNGPKLETFIGSSTF